MVTNLADGLAEMPSGFCSDDYALRQYGVVSPDGVWVALQVDRDSSKTRSIHVLRVLDLRSGHWRPVTAEQPSLGFLEFWVTAETFVVKVGKGLQQWDYFRCDVSGRCGPLTLPTGSPNATLVQRFGG